MDAAGGAPSRCGVPIRRSGGPTLRGRAMQRSDVSARCGVPIRRFGHAEKAGEKCGLGGSSPGTVQDGFARPYRFEVANVFSESVEFVK